jgi:hypothetical protein
MNLNNFSFRESVFEGNTIYYYYYYYYFYY